MTPLSTAGGADRGWGPTRCGGKGRSPRSRRAGPTCRPVSSSSGRDDGLAESSDGEDLLVVEAGGREVALDQLDQAHVDHLPGRDFGRPVEELGELAGLRRPAEEVLGHHGVGLQLGQRRPGDLDEGLAVLVGGRLGVRGLVRVAGGAAGLAVDLAATSGLGAIDRAEDTPRAIEAA